jgi:N-acyl-L-homoserine lactone synthetase
MRNGVNDIRIEQSYVYKIAHGKLRVDAIRLHRKRYVEVGFMKRNEEDLYVRDAIYFVAQSLGEVVGTTRLIFKPMDELPTIKNFQIYKFDKIMLSQLDRQKYVEISAFTKEQQHNVALGLIQIALQYSITNGISHWICCIDERVYNYMRRIFHFPFKVIGIEKVYLGSVTVPCALNLMECLTILKEKKYALYHFLQPDIEEKKEVIL